MDYDRLAHFNTTLPQGPACGWVDLSLELGREAALWPSRDIPSKGNQKNGSGHVTLKVVSSMIHCKVFVPSIVILLNNPWDFNQV